MTFVQPLPPFNAHISVDTKWSLPPQSVRTAANSILKNNEWHKGMRVSVDSEDPCSHMNLLLASLDDWGLICSCPYIIGQLQKDKYEVSDVKEHCDFTLCFVSGNGWKENLGCSQAHTHPGFLAISNRAGNPSSPRNIPFFSQ
jgi:hypothetical protein